MVAIRVEGFAGIAPRMSARLLPPQGAVAARNAKLISGELRGLHELKVVKDFTALGYVVRRAFRIPNDINVPIPIQGADTWVPFQDAEVDFLRTPVANDSFERYYWTGDSTLYGGVPKYNTKARLLASQPPFRLGIPTPATAPTVTPPGGTDRSRIYLYTFVSAYGEEGPPSPPTALTVGTNGTWNLSALPTTVANAAERNITTKRIYRTVPGLTTSEFYRVADIPLAQATYADSITDDVVAANPILASTTWAEPPAGLKGLTVHPGGFMLGFSGRDLYMSEPYRPHAWPSAYVLTMETEIVGVSVYNNSIIVTTNSRPYIVQGVNPASMMPTKIDSIDPCVARRSMATTLEGVYYASPQGIVLANTGGVQLVTHQLFTREEWYTRYNPGGIKAVPYGMQYIAFDKGDSGFIFSPKEQLAPLSEMDRFNNVNMIQVDAYSGDVYVIRQNQVGVWDPPDTVPYYYTWLSKEFDFPKPVNFGALRLKFRNIERELDDTAIADYATFNAGRIAKPLHCFNLTTFNGVRKETVAGWVNEQNRSPIGGSPLIPTQAVQSVNPAVQIRIWARMPNSGWELVYSQTITDEGVYRLQTGFKSETWQFELVGNTDVYSIALAETAKDLQNA